MVLFSDSLEITWTKYIFLLCLQLQAWNVDTISKDGFSKSTINKPMSRQKEELSEEEKENKMKKFVQDNKSDLKAFGWLSKMDDSKGTVLQMLQLISCYN